MDDLMSRFSPAAQSNKSGQVPFSRKQAKELKLHKHIIVAEIALIAILVSLRWFVGGWWIDWGNFQDHAESGRPGSSDVSENSSAENMGMTVPADYDESLLDPGAVTGVPSVDPSLGWSVLRVQEGFDVHVCAVLNADADGSLPIWFSSERTNTVWIKLLILDEAGNLLGETGILKPGEYVERLQLKEGTQSCAVTVQIKGYEPGTVDSAGNIALANTLVVAN